jgi:hypothetical protein
MTARERYLTRVRTALANRSTMTTGQFYAQMQRMNNHDVCRFGVDASCVGVHTEGDSYDSAPVADLADARRVHFVDGRCSNPAPSVCTIA